MRTDSGEGRFRDHGQRMLSMVEPPFGIGMRKSHAYIAWGILHAPSAKGTGRVM